MDVEVCDFNAYPFLSVKAHDRLPHYISEMEHKQDSYSIEVSIINTKNIHQNTTNVNAKNVIQMVFCIPSALLSLYTWC